jgi:hypothetical protein
LTELLPQESRILMQESQVAELRNKVQVLESEVREKVCILLTLFISISYPQGQALKKSQRSQGIGLKVYRL